MSNRPTVYLAGPVAGLSYEAAMSWRAWVAEQLEPAIIAISPMRGKGFLQGERVLGSNYTHPLATPVGIVARDRYDVRRADAMLVNFLGATAVSIGTCVEFGWADAYGKPIVLVMPFASGPDHHVLHDHPFIHRLAGFRVATLADGVAVVRSILLPS